MRAGLRSLDRLWLGPALLVLGLIAWAAISLWGAATDGVEWDVAGRVFEVVAGGPAERAGLQVGDVMVTVDGCARADWDVCGYRIGQPGDVIYVKFRREGELCTTALTAELPSVNYRLVLLLILLVSLVFCLSSLVLLLLRPRALETRVFYALCQTAAAALTVGALGSAMVPLGPRWSYVLTGMLPPVMIHFHVVFPERRGLGRRRWPLIVLYGAGLGFVALRWLAYPRVEVSQAAMSLWLLLGLATSIGLVVVAYVTTRSPAARRRIRLLVFGTVVGLGPIALLSAVPTAGFGAAPWIRWPYVIPLVAAMPLAYAVALWRSTLVKFDRALNRALVYLVVSGLLFGAYFVTLTLVQSLMPAELVGRAAFGAALTLVAAVTLRPLREWVQHLVDRLFYGGWYDYQGLVEDVGQALGCTLDVDTLVEVLVRRVPRAMHLPGAALWLKRAGRLEPVGAASVCAQTAQAWAEESGAIAEPGEVRLTPDCAVVPLVVEDQEIGVWVLVGRPSGEWGPEDGRILTALGRQAALAAQNVRLVEALRAEVAKVERMHRRLLVAREDERADLARELHDGVVQDLIGLRYRLEALQDAGGDPQRVGVIRSQVGTLVDELRRICSALRPSALDQWGLAAALRTLAREVTVRGLPVQTHLEDVSLPDAVAVGLYRIGQEALSNALRHAAASQATVTLARQGEQVVLTVTDDGCGFDPTSAGGRDGCLGLLGMSERAQALGGHLEIESAPGDGTRVTVTWDSSAVPDLGVAAEPYPHPAQVDRPFPLDFQSAAGQKPVEVAAGELLEVLGLIEDGAGQPGTTESRTRRRPGPMSWCAPR